jgi:hypothetical protein
MSKHLKAPIIHQLSRPNSLVAATFPQLTDAGSYPVGGLGFGVIVPGHQSIWWTELDESDGNRWITKPDVGPCTAAGYTNLPNGVDGYFAPNQKMGCLVISTQTSQGTWTTCASRGIRIENPNDDQLMFFFCSNDIVDPGCYGDNHGIIAHTVAVG